LEILSDPSQAQGDLKSRLLHLMNMTLCWCIVQ